MTNLLIACIPSIFLSFMLTYICIPPIIRVSKAKHLFDEPNHRKLNKSEVPTLGGVGIFIGLSLSCIVFQNNEHYPEMSYLFGAILMLFFIGLKDDILVISAKKKFMVQLAAVSLLVFLGDIRIDNMNDLFGLQNLPQWFSQIISFIVILFLVNAMNLIDGIDGLAAGITLFVSLFLGVWFYNEGLHSYMTLSFAMAGSLLAFLRFNLWGKENKIFMGDTGSLIIGAVLATLVIKFINAGAGTTHISLFKHFPTIALSLLIVPVCDVLRVFIIRICQKRSPFSADMNHIHHLLIRLGMNHIQASGFLIGYTSLFLVMSLLIQDYIPVTFSFLSILSFSFILIGLLVHYNKLKSRRKQIQLELTRKILTSGITDEEAKLFETINKKLFFLKKRA